MNVFVKMCHVLEAFLNVNLWLNLESENGMKQILGCCNLNLCGSTVEGRFNLSRIYNIYVTTENIHVSAHLFKTQVDV